MQVVPNPELQGIVATGANVLPQRVVEDAFRLQHGRTLNFSAFGDAVTRINDWYKDHGLLGQVGKSAQLFLALYQSDWRLWAGSIALPCLLPVPHSNLLPAHLSLLPGQCCLVKPKLYLLRSWGGRDCSWLALPHVPFSRPGMSRMFQSSCFANDLSMI